jgi:hypothetical protein
MALVFLLTKKNIPKGRGPSIATAAAPNLSFGPVMERVLKDPGESRTNAFIDFEKGVFLIPPTKLPLTNYPAVWDWATAQGIDAVANTSQEIRGLLGYELIAAQLSDEDWEAPPPLEQLRAKIVGAIFNNSRFGGMPPRSQTILSVNTITTNPKPSKTWLFQTRSGTLGLLQFLEYTDSPRGWIKFRYKLVQNSASTNSQ